MSNRLINLFNWLIKSIYYLIKLIKGLIDLSNWSIKLIRWLIWRNNWDPLQFEDKIEVVFFLKKIWGCIPFKEKLEVVFLLKKKLSSSDRLAEGRLGELIVVLTQSSLSWNLDWAWQYYHRYISKYIIYSLQII